MSSDGIPRALSPIEQLRRKWTIEVVGGDTNLGFEEWSRGSEPRPLHTPPRMTNEYGYTDGVFVFHGTHSDLGGQMEVVAMTTGNVEFTINNPDDDPDGGLIFNLSHLDRMDLVRALLHDFHYSPERGGPNDDQD